MIIVQKVQLCFKECYCSEIWDVLCKQFGYGNVMQILMVMKVVVNMGVGEVVWDVKLINGVVNDLVLIIGQKLEVCWVCKFIVQFKLCEGMLVGV